MSAPAEPPSRRKLAFATLLALGVALAVLVLFVLPAEYGVDPTGAGRMFGLDALAPDAATTGDPSGAAPEATTTPLVFATYESRFPLLTTETLRQEGYLAEGETILVPFQLAQANATRVTMRLEFADRNASASGQRTRPDTFEIELKAPHGDVSGGVLVRSEENTGGGMGAAVYAVREPPASRELEAASDAEARAAFTRNDPPDFTLAGEWKARITLVEAGGAEGAPGLPLPQTALDDAGNDWLVVIAVQTYSLDVAEKPGTRQRSDVATLTLPPGGEVEYKLRMALGKRLDYTWRTDGPVVYVDFHGEKTGESSGAFTRHKNGDFAQDAGTLVAPFDGSHGWFWRNTSGQSVTLTLETRGQYDVIGRV